MENKIYRNLARRVAAAAVVAVALCAPSEAGARMTYKLNDTVRSGFNALDHVLQKPLGNPVFENKRFGDHLFLSGGAGVSMGGLHTRPGAALELQLGDWVTPVHGWRVAFNAGALSVQRGNPYPYFGAVSADYLLNFTSLLRGHRSGRWFELVGGIGAEYRRERSEGVWGNELGIRASLQARFNVSRSLYLYLEPRLTMSAGTKYRGIPDEERRFRPDMSFYVGLGYRLLRGAERANGTQPFLNVDDSHLFFGAGVGASTFLRDASRSSLGPEAHIYVGKWFSSAAGLRLKAQFGRYKTPWLDPDRRYIASGMLDYVWNITNAFGGYRPREVFNLNLNLGVGAGYVNESSGKLYPGVEAGLTASFRLSPNWSLYIEPQVQMFTRGFSEAAGKGRYLAPMGSVMAGLTYTIGNFYHDHPESLGEYLKANNYFLTLSGAPSKRLRGNYGYGAAGSVGFGKRFTPVSSWRVTADGEIFNNSPRFVSLGLSADYMFSISTSMAGFNPDRLFDLSGVVGITGGMAHTEGPVKPMFGAKVGLHGAFRLSDALELFIEPQFVAMKSTGVYSDGWNPGLRLMAGLAYRLGRKDSFAADAIYKSPMEGRNNFASLSVGPAAFSGNLGLRNINGALDVNVGRWFTLVSGLRLGASYDFMPDSDASKRLNLGIVRADYLLNVTSLITRDESRRFHIIGVVGGGIAFSDAEYSKAGLTAGGGVQFRYNLPANIDVHIEPNVSFIMNRVTPNYESTSRFTAIGRLMFGASYRF
ncbi:MAG: hypothetical protein NC210_10355 [[Clostridium] fimetarium]|nr:hypothetical protein [[Clostridium] fimetarium]